MFLFVLQSPPSLCVWYHWFDTSNQIWRCVRLLKGETMHRQVCKRRIVRKGLQKSEGRERYREMADHRKEQRCFPSECRLKDEEDRLHMQELHDAKRKKEREKGMLKRMQ
jgi:hypothetical protein